MARYAVKTQPTVTNSINHCKTEHISQNFFLIKVLNSSHSIYINNTACQDLSQEFLIWLLRLYKALKECSILIRTFMKHLFNVVQQTEVLSCFSVLSGVLHYIKGVALQVRNPRAKVLSIKANKMGNSIGQRLNGGERQHGE